MTMLPSLKINTWTEKSLSSLTEEMSKEMSKDASRPLVLIDGAAGSGKTTLAKEIAVRLNATLVHTDDVSWCADPVQWDGELLSGIIAPWDHGDLVAYRPSGWIKENRPGSIKADPEKPLVIEGMGACRKTLRQAAAFSIWVDTAPEIARNRVVQRDLANGENGGTVASITEFADWWDSLLLPLYLEEEPWKYVDIIVSGSLGDVPAGKLMICKNFRRGFQ